MGSIARTFVSVASLLLAAGTAAAQDSAYQLLDPMRLSSISAAGARDWRVETAINLDDRQQLRLASLPPAYRLPTQGLNYDPARATYRYTVIGRESWAWRVGLTANPNQFGSAGTFKGEKFGALPMLHMAGEARLAPRWRVGVDADGLMTPRGHALELGLRLNYQLRPNFSLYGGYQLSESGGEAEEYYGSGFSNAANVGLRLRF